MKLTVWGLIAGATARFCLFWANLAFAQIMHAPIRSIPFFLYGMGSMKVSAMASYGICVVVIAGKVRPDPFSRL